jgi:DNA modification methylase
MLNPFAGSSTTEIVAVTSGMMFIDIDNEKRYFELSVKRFENLNEHKISSAKPDKINCNSV